MTLEPYIIAIGYYLLPEDGLPLMSSETVKVFLQSFIADFFPLTQLPG